MKITSRTRVLDTLRKYHTLTAYEISRYLGMTSANVRHHLKMLKQDELVEEIKTSKYKEKGRPEKIYRINTKTKGIALEIICDILLSLLKDPSSQRINNEILYEISAQLTKKINLKEISGFQPRLSNSIEKLNFLLYQAEWEAGRSGPIIKFKNCPYKMIIHNHPEFCRIDTLLLEELTGLHFIQSTKLETDERGMENCTFINHL